MVEMCSSVMLNGVWEMKIILTLGSISGGQPELPGKILELMAKTVFRFYGRKSLAMVILETSNFSFLDFKTNSIHSGFKIWNP